MTLSFTLGSRDDDAGIRRLLATNPVPGTIQLRYEREPDYFAGCAAMGPFTQVLVAKDDDRVVGVACRAIRPMYINGQREDIGYLGQLRVDHHYRGRFLVLRGFRLLRELHDDGRTRSYVTTIIEGNAEAEGVLVHRARGVMPRYRRLGTLVTLALETYRPYKPYRAHRAYDVLSFLQKEAPTRQFFPAGDYHGDFVAIERNGEIAGAAALWDQRAYKQTIIHDYSRAMRVARPLYNAFASLTGRATLPPRGTALQSAYGSFFCVANDDAEVARDLIRALLAEAHARGLTHLLLGFSDADPLLPVARTFRHVAYPAGIYTVGWDDGDIHDRLDKRPPHLELATL